MPLYEYGCSACRARLERRQRFDEEPLRECPICGGSLSRILQPVGIVFKGSGWYSTDNRPTNGAATPGGETPTPLTDSAASTNGKTDGKTDARKSDTSATTPAPKKAEAKPAAKD